MPAKRHTGIDFEVIKLSLKAIFPLFKSEQSVNIFYQLIMQVLPFNRVEFILAEILELQSSEGRATTHIYSSFDEQTNEDLIAKYFEIIEGFIEKRGWSLSRLDNLYFGQRIWCAQISSAKAATDRVRKDHSKRWYESKRDKKLDLKPGEKMERPEDEVEEMFQDYIRQLYDLCLKRYAHSYVLLIPISLNALAEYSQYKAKLGAIFLHFSTRSKISPQRLRRIYGRILLFWHYYFTSELVGKRQREIDELKEAQTLFASVQQQTSRVLDIMHDLQTPLRNLEMALSPVYGVICGGESLDRFFQPRGRPVQLNEHLIAPVHAWSDQMARTPEGLSRYRDLTAGVLLEVLGFVDSTNSKQTLWEQLCLRVNESGGGPKQSLIAAIAEYIPELRKKEPEPRDIERAFKSVKAWFNDAYKPQDSLPYSLLAMALKSLKCSVNAELSLGKDSFWVASKRPIETIDALVVLHDMYTFKEAALTMKEGDAHLLEIRLEEPHGMDESGAQKLEASLSKALSVYENRDVPRLGNMTYVFLKLFGFANVRRDGVAFTRESGSHRLSVVFGGDRDSMNKISIESIGKVFR